MCITIGCDGNDGSATWFDISSSIYVANGGKGGGGGNNSSKIGYGGTGFTFNGNDGGIGPGWSGAYGGSCGKTTTLFSCTGGTFTAAPNYGGGGASGPNGSNYRAGGNGFLLLMW